LILVLDGMGSDTVALEEDGFLVVPDVVSAPTCDAVAASLLTISEGRAGTRRLLGLDWCQAVVFQLRGLLVRRRLLADDAVAVQCTFFDKSSQNNWLVAYHQDLSIPVAERVETPECSAWSEKEGDLFVQPSTSVLQTLLAVRLHIDDCNPRNGPLRVLTGTHKLGRLKADRIQELRSELREDTCTAPRGSVLLLRPLLLHASSKGVDHSPRRVLHFLFGPRALPFGLRWRHAV
jgi:Phytanoyl-CoA dioxygenase (PhyH)